VKVARGPLSVLPALAGSLVAGLLLLLPPRTNPVELFLLDARFVVASAVAPAGERSSDVALVLMDEDSEASLGVPYGSRWRAFHPRLLSVLREAGVSIVVFDAEFSGAESGLDAEFVVALQASGPVIAGESRVGSTIPGIRAALAAIGWLEVHEYGSVPREVVSSPQDTGIEALAVVVARRFPGSREVPPRFWIDYRRPPSFFPTFSYIDVLNSAEGRIADEGRTPLSLLQGKIVLLGRDIPGGDQFVLPPAPGRLLPGVIGQAYALQTLLAGTPIRTPPLLIEASGVMTIALLVAFTLSLRGRMLRVLLLALVAIATVVAAQVVLIEKAIWFQVAPLAVAFVAGLGVHWTARRVTLTRALSRTIGFNADLIERFRREQARSGGHLEREVCVLVADVRDYTRFVSTHEPRQVAAVMGDYVKAVEGIVASRGGYVNKYVGDEVVAVFGFPLSDERCEERAIAAARAMLQSIDSLRHAWTARGLPGIQRIGIGMDRGPVTFAEVGGRTKSQFDMIGNCINGASRLQALTKTHGTALVVSEELYRALAGTPHLQSAFKKIGRTAIRGQGTRTLYGLAPGVPP
jgi:class 3 adenylate cyclase/CHASE2 domain-containing sensor protein